MSTYTFVVIVQKIILSILFLSLAIGSSIVPAYSVHGVLGELLVRNVDGTRVQLIVRFDNNYRGECGSADFLLSRPDWNDVDLLARAVSSGRVVKFVFDCNGRMNFIKQFNWY